MSPSGQRGESWFTAVYQLHHPDVVRYGLRRLADPDAAGELAQEVFVVAWRRREEVPEPSLPWLYGVARRLLANHRRAGRSRPAPLPLLDTDPLPVPGADAVIGLLDLRAALAGLTEPDQEVLRLVGWEGLSLAELATALGCSRGTAAVRLYRARRRLTAALRTPARPSPSRVAPVRI
ncbi:sigma-70 family RNA polymerase sigma factor [Catellatospora sp. NPDC049609]|uniref:RNA polymerase sigma factor n=1 Tax=Catellatospora sp. NPDC049609 TaxID=3155505 RepID=UPI003412C6D0